MTAEVCGLSARAGLQKDLQDKIQELQSQSDTVTSLGERRTKLCSTIFESE